MALKKSMKVGQIDADYLKIIGLHSNTLYQSTVARVALYVNKEAREKDEAGYIKIIPYVINKIDLTMADAYKALKEKGGLEDSEDI